MTAPSPEAPISTTPRVDVLFVPVTHQERLARGGGAKHMTGVSVRADREGRRAAFLVDEVGEDLKTLRDLLLFIRRVL